MENKRQIRKKHLLWREALGEEFTAQRSGIVNRRLIEFFGHMDALGGVYGYYPYRKEVSLLDLYEWLLGKQIPLAFPRISGETMEFYLVRSMDDFTEGAFHIPEPKQGLPSAGLSEACCLVPGSVFDRFGNRYGYGKGYYDRYFEAHDRMYRIGVAYEGQVEAHIPTESTDIKMQALVTDKDLYVWEKRKGDVYGIN